MHASGGGIGYMLGTKAGRERYGQILAAAKRAPLRLDEAGRRRGTRIQAPATVALGAAVAGVGPAQRSPHNINPRSSR